MTVKELIAILQELPDQDKEIKIQYDDGWIIDDIYITLGNDNNESSQPEVYFIG